MRAWLGALAPPYPSARGVATRYNAPRTLVNIGDGHAAGGAHAIAASRQPERWNDRNSFIRFHRKVVMSRLVNPAVNMEFHQISNRGKKLPPEAEEFTSFLKSYVARWAGHAGVL
jgi:hypothetical protein